MTPENPVAGIELVFRYCLFVFFLWIHPLAWHRYSMRIIILYSTNTVFRNISKLEICKFLSKFRFRLLPWLWPGLGGRFFFFCFLVNRMGCEGGSVRTAGIPPMGKLGLAGAWRCICGVGTAACTVQNNHLMRHRR